MIQTEIDWQARQERDAGMAQALDHAERVECDWGATAYKCMSVFCTGAKGTKFTSHNFIDWYQDMCLKMPPTPKAFGSIFTKAAKNGLIRKVGYRPHPLRHASPTVLWEVV